MNLIKQQILEAYNNKTTGLTNSIAKLKKKNPKISDLDNATIKSVLENNSKTFQVNNRKAKNKSKLSYHAQYFGELIHIDLMFLSSPRNTNQNILIKDDNGDLNKYLLVCVDTYSRYLFVYPVKSKKADEITRKLKEMISYIREEYYEGYNTKINLLHDAGKEFNKKLIEEIPETKSITSKNKFGAVLSENYIYKIRDKIRLLSDKSIKEISIEDLHSIVYNINTDINHAISNKVTPDEIFHEDLEPEKEIKISKYKSSQFKIGDLVRTLNYVEKDGRLFVKKSAYNNYSDKIFVIYKVKNENSQNIWRYSLATTDGEKILKNKFYEYELLKVPYTYLVNSMTEQDIKRNSIFTAEEIKIYHIIER